MKIWRKRGKKTRPLCEEKDKYLSHELPTPEVFNLWDVLTSIEKENARQAVKTEATLSPQQRLFRYVARPFKNRFNNVIGGEVDDDLTTNLLDSLVFIPSSEASSYKESISKVGNGKARLKVKM